MSAAHVGAGIAQVQPQALRAVLVPSRQRQVEVAVVVIVGPASIAEVDAHEPACLGNILNQLAVVIAQHLGDAQAGAVGLGGLADENEIRVAVPVVVTPGGFTRPDAGQIEAAQLLQVLGRNCPC